MESLSSICRTPYNLFSPNRIALTKLENDQTANTIPKDIYPVEVVFSSELIIGIMYFDI